MKKQIAAIVDTARSRGQRAHRLPRARPRPLLGDLEDVHRPRLRRCSAWRTSPTRPTPPASATRSSRPSTSSTSSPDIIVLADTVCCGADAGTVGRRPGWSTVTAVKNGSIVRIDDSIASRWGPRLVELLPRGGDRARAPGAAELTWSADSAPLPCWSALAACRRAGRARRSSSWSSRSSSACSPGPSTSGSVTILQSLGAQARVSRRRRRRSTESTSRSSGRSGCRASCSPRSSASTLALAGRDVPGRLPEPARRPVPARRRRRRRPRRDGRDRLPPAATRRTASCCPPAAFVGGDRRGRRSPTRSAARRARAGRGDPRARGRHRRSFFTAVQTFVQQQNADTLQEVYSWILGGLPSSGWSDVVIVLPYVVVAPSVILAHRRVLDVLSVGDDEAASLGVNVGRVRLVARRRGDGRHGGGGRGHRADRLRRDHRPARDPAHRRHELPRRCCRCRSLVGAGFLVLADVVARTALAPAEIPIGDRDGVLRRAVLRARAAHDRGGGAHERDRARRASRCTLGGRPSSTASTLESSEGEWVALIGPNGAGKTTLLRAIAGLVPLRGHGRARRRRRRRR